MKIALIDTVDKSGGNSGPSVAIAALAGYLTRHGNDVGVIDLFFSSGEEQNDFFRQHWGLIGITVTSFAYKVAIDAAKMIKKINRYAVPIVLGGAHVSVAREGVLAEPKIDFAIYGEGEVPLLKLANLIEREKNPGSAQFREIEGLVFRDGDDIVVNAPPQRIEDLDSLPFPPYEFFPMAHYATHTLSTSRGCPYGCVYCASSAILGKRWIAKSPHRIVGEIKHAVQRWGNKPFSIVDDSFNLDMDRVKDFCRLLIKEKIGIRWGMCGGMRADRIDLEMLLLMKESGCGEIGIGVESANAHVLTNVEKGETIEEIREGIRLIKKAGMPVHASFMVGNPGDTPETIRESIEFFKSERLDGVSVFTAVPYPHTKLWEYVKKNGRFLRKDYVNYHDFSDEPVFETNDFTFRERIDAYRLARREALRLERKPIFYRIVYLVIIFMRHIKDHGILCSLKKAVSYAGHGIIKKFGWQKKKTDGRNTPVQKIETRFSCQG